MSDLQSRKEARENLKKEYDTDDNDLREHVYRTYSEEDVKLLIKMAEDDNYCKGNILFIHGKESARETLACGMSLKPKVLLESLENVPLYLIRVNEGSSRMSKLVNLIACWRLKIGK